MNDKIKLHAIKIGDDIKIVDQDGRELEGYRSAAIVPTRTTDDDGILNVESIDFHDKKSSFVPKWDESMLT